MVNIYQQVARNKFQSAVIITVFSLFITLVTYLIVYTLELPTIYLFLGLFFSLLSSLGSYFYGDQIILTLNKAKLANRKEFFNFYTVTENLCLGSQLPIPKIYVIDDPSPNAFATGRNPEHAVICATTGLLSKLNRSQLEAVISHELSHIRNYDIRLMMIVSILIGTLYSLINYFRFSNFSRRDRQNKQESGPLAIIGLVLIIFSPIIAKLIQLAISRRREYLADASAVKLTKQPQSLIEALTIISQDSSLTQTASRSTAALYISNPFKKDNIASLFSTHPPIEKRIQELRNMVI